MRVLVIEDDRKVASFIEQGLREDGYVVDVAHDGVSGALNAQVYDYDALLVDIMLPGKNGYEVVHELRTSGKSVPILMLTARDSTDDIVRGLNEGADDYLTKPFAFDELLARVRALVRRAPAERPAVLEVGSLRLDPAAHRAWRGDAELDLSPKELALLEVFMRSPGRVLSRSQLLDSAWDIAFERRSNIVDVYVRYLRDKIDRPFDVASIETIRGVGYRLRDSV